MNTFFFIFKGFKILLTIIYETRIINYPFVYPLTINHSPFLSLYIYIHKQEKYYDKYSISSSQNLFIEICSRYLGRFYDIKTAFF